MRAFIAIEIPTPIRDAMGDLVKRLRKTDVRVSWVPPERMHLTLRFMGEMDEAVQPALAAMLRSRCEGQPPFKLDIEGIGAFPNRRKPAVIWCGLGGDLDALNAIQRIVEERVREAGLEPDKKRFKPHVTLGRVRDSRNATRLTPLLTKHAAWHGDAFEVRAVSLFSSTLTPKGPHHTRLEEFPF